jgi:hypothetical protein
MEMLKSSKDFRIQFLWVVSQIGQRGVDPRKHARSRPMSLNVRWLRHRAFLVGLNEGSIVLIAIKVPKCVISAWRVAMLETDRAQSVACLYSGRTNRMGCQRRCRYALDAAGRRWRHSAA